MAYKYGNRQQITLLPESIEDYVSNDDPVRVYDAFIDAIDNSALGIDIDENKVGNSSYHPISMLKVLVYSYSYGWRSSRKIERALHHNLSFIWLSGGLKPDHKTISNFRRDHKDVLKNLLKQCARMCLKLNLIEGNILFADGSKVRANAGKSNTKNIETWEKYQKYIEAKIEELLDECETIDESEHHSLVKITKDLRDTEKLNTKIKGLLKEMQDEGLERINSTDPNCKIMKGRQGSHASYNCQIVADDANGLIVSTDTTVSMNDLNQLTTQIKKAEETLEKESEVNCADAGYSSVDDLKVLVESGRTVIVPNNNQMNQKKNKNNQDLFKKQFFDYDSKKDCYTCPAGHQLYRSSIRKEAKRTRIEYRLKRSIICKNCKFFGKCTKSKTGRRLYRSYNEEVKERLEQIYNSDFGQEIYAKRKMIIEHPFGHIKHNLGVGAFLLRGLEGVKAEFNLLGTCFNIARMITLLGGVPKAVEQIRG